MVIDQRGRVSRYGGRHCGVTNHRSGKHPSVKGDARRESSPEAKSSEAQSSDHDTRRRSPVAAAAPPVPPPAPMVATPPSTPSPQRPKLAPAPERGWYYKDLSDTVQGPFSREAMRRWFEREFKLRLLLSLWGLSSCLSEGYLKPDLLLRIGKSPSFRFHPLRELFPAPAESPNPRASAPFLDLMVAPSDWVTQMVQMIAQKHEQQQRQQQEKRE